MNDTLKTDTVANAVRSIDGIPHWDLLADELVYPLIVPRGKRTFLLRAHMKPYASSMLARCLEQLTSAQRFDAKGDRELIEANPHLLLPLFRENFKRLDGITETDPEKQVQQLSTDLQLRIINDGFGGMTVDDDRMAEHADEDSGLLDLAASDPMTAFPTVQELVDADDQCVTIHMTHTIDGIRESDRQKYRTASRRTVRSRRSELVVSVKPNVIAEIYRDRIQSVQGFSLGTELCTASNKTKWEPLIPLWHKLLVINELMSEVQLKNGK